MNLRDFPERSKSYPDAPYLELWHPRMVPTTHRSGSAIDRRVDFAFGAEVDFFIEISLATMNVYGGNVVALFTLDGGHHDITSLRKELDSAHTPVLFEGETNGSEDVVKRVRLVVEGNLDPGPHTITITILKMGEYPVPLSNLLESSPVLAQRQMLVASR